MSKFQPPATSNTSVTIKDTTDTARSLIAKLAPEIAMALPKHLNPERVGRICLTEIRKNPKLLECSQQSLAAAIIQSAQLGLELGSGLNLAALIPSNNKQQDGSYKMECRFEMMYQGLVELARRTGKLLTIFAEVVYADDEFEIVRGLHPDLKHKPVKFRDKEPANDAIIGAYAVAELPGPEGVGVLTQWEWVPRWYINYIRSKSKQPNGPGWTLWFPAMCRKTAIKQLSKLLPKSAELCRAIDLDDANEAGDKQDLVSDLAGTPDVVTIESEVVEPPPAEKPEKNQRKQAATIDDPAPYLARITKHIEAKHFTLEQVKKLAGTDNISSAPYSLLKTIAEDLDGLAAQENK